jgi:hypothetical protein
MFYIYLTIIINLSYLMVKSVEIVALIVLLASVTSFNLKAISINKETPQLSSGNIQSGLQGFSNRTA